MSATAPDDRTQSSIPSGRLGLQVHCLRHQLARDVEGTLAQIARRGFRVVELVSFPGCRGNPWGDFGALADWPPSAIRAALDKAGLVAPSAHVTARELETAQIDRTLEWLAATGVSRAVLGALAVAPDSGIDAWRRSFDALNVLGERVRRAGLEFGFHTQTNLWSTVDGIVPAEELLRRVDPRSCRIEYDPSGALIYGHDPAAYLRERPDVFYALHLRDGVRPPQPVAYLPAEPLGAGEIDFAALITAARRTSIEWHFLEMEVSRPDAVLDAIDASSRFLHERRFSHPPQ